MKLVISVINRDDLYSLTDALIGTGHSATIIGTTGGFLREGNATLLVGTEDAKLDAVMATIRANCRTRIKYVVPFPPAAELEGYLYEPIEVEVGGAVVFVIDVDRFVKF